jgi:hypothetical protein
MKRPAPLSTAGRQTLVYLVFAGAGPALTGLIVWAMYAIRAWQGASAISRLDRFAALANLVAAGMLVIVVALACFVSIRAIKIGAHGLEATGSGGDGNATATVTTDVGTASVTVPTTPAPPTPPAAVDDDPPPVDDKPANS